MSFKFTLVLLAAAIVAVAGFALAQRSVPSTTASPSPSSSTIILDMRFADITNVDIKYGDKETVITKSGLKWSLEKPVQDSNVDQGKISGVVGQLAPLTADRSVGKAGDDLTPYGLKSPQVTVTLSGGGKTETLLIGDKNVNGNSYYATRQEGSDVGLISSTLVSSIEGLATNPPQATPTPVPASGAPAGSPAVPPASPGAS
ncbi:MAG TPA: DUF4340 domain-containing protein [Chloroflexota bacterium]|nr:DUF4340 domain-containing protein [Chloroflexota bacterium]